MCGLTGFLWGRDSKIGSVSSQLKSMTEAIRHRGPDDTGTWVDDKAKVAIGHRRLSILDLSSAGHQPMVSKSKRYVIAFNGEIYNHNELRDQLAKLSSYSLDWSGHSDTETLLMCFEVWGVEQTLSKLVGMFAISLYDIEEELFYLIRDRMGEKPLYYGWNNGIFLFGSELKSIKSFSSFSAEVDRNALALFLKYDYIPVPFSIYKGISKLPQGSFLKLKMENNQWKQDFVPDSISYWSMAEVVDTRKRTHDLVNGDKDATEKLDHLLGKSIRQQMISDVPLGAFLSGGVDSSVVVALMQKQAIGKVKTFTIGFNEKQYNEAEYAKAVAHHLGTEHTELYVSPENAMDIIPCLPQIYDEPFADSSQIPTLLVSKMARQHVSVSLSGDGGDEIFGGYNRYLMANRAWKNMEKVPLTLRKYFSKGITSISPKIWGGIINGASGVLPTSLKITHPGDKVYKLADMLSSRNIDDVYDGLVSHWKNPFEIVIGCTSQLDTINESMKILDFNNPENKMMYLDSITYLPDDILTKVDRAAMGVSLETRAPFLNHNVVEFAWQLPFDMKIRNNEGKWILRQVLDKYVPRKLIDRPKMGFGVPIDSWLRGPLRDWAESLLSESRLRQEGFFHPEPIRKIWNEHLSGHRNWQYHLWSVLMFQAWLEDQDKPL
jgi:asparagine synthase (glutamine-hydrolysing)